MSLSTLFSNAINSNNSNQQQILFTPPIDIIINHVFGKELYPWQKEMIHKWFKTNTDTEGGNPYGTNLKTTADVLNISPTRIQFWDVPALFVEYNSFDSLNLSNVKE